MQDTCCLKARAAHDRFGLTHNLMLRENFRISNSDLVFLQLLCLQRPNLQLGISGVQA